MKIIDDTSSEILGFPLRKLISTVSDAYDEKLDTVFRIVLFGGAGPRIWEVESQLNEREKVFLSLGDLLAVCTGDDNVCDELCCARDGTFFGLSDATFLFIQSRDKNLEDFVCSCFQKVRDFGDSDEQAICRNML